MTPKDELRLLTCAQVEDSAEDFFGVAPESPDHINLHPNQLDGLGCGDPEDALIELIDLKHGFMEV